MKKTRSLSILVSFCMMLTCMVGMSVTAGAECYPLEGNTKTIDYDTDEEIESITVNFHYVDSDGGFTDYDARSYNLIFTTDSNMRNASTSGMASGSGSCWANLITARNIPNAVYSDNAAVNSANSNVSHTQRLRTYFPSISFPGGDPYCNEISGTFTLTGTDVLSRFVKGTTYYGLLCSTNGSGVWYTGVCIDIGTIFNTLDETTAPAVSSSSDDDTLHPGDELTAETTATDLTYEWYYDSDLDPDGAPKAGSVPIGTGDTYTLKPDDIGKKIVVIATQSQNASGDDLDTPRKQTSAPIGPVSEGPVHLEDLEDGDIIDATAGDVVVVNGDQQVQRFVKGPNDGDYTELDATETIVLDGGKKYIVTITERDDGGINYYFEVYAENDDNEDDDEDEDVIKPRREWAEKPTYVPSGTSVTRDPVDGGEEPKAQEPEDTEAPADTEEPEETAAPEIEPEPETTIPAETEITTGGSTGTVDGSASTNENPHTGAALGGIAVLALAGAAMLVSKKRK